jgi:hypothetical protein
MAGPLYDKPKTNTSEPVPWLELAWESVTWELSLYLVIQFVTIPFTIVDLAMSGSTWFAAGLTLLWLPTIAWLIRDIVKLIFSRASWFFLGAWAAVGAGWMAYEHFVV